MSRQAARNTPVTLGSVARVLDVPLSLPEPTTRPGEGAPRKSRTPLALVVSTPRRTRRSIVGIVFLMVVAALTVVLVMSISVSQGQYELVALKSQQDQLYKNNQFLEQEIAAKAAPQELVARAAGLGMVPAGTTGQIDVRTKTVSGSPQPASADTKGLSVIPPALIDKPKAPAPNAGADVPLAPGANGGAAAGAAPQTPAPPVAQTPELHGGTIPAPVEKDG